MTAHTRPATRRRVRPVRVLLTPVLATALAVGLAGTLSGCEPTGVTGAQLGEAVGVTFAHLYVRQQTTQGHPVPSARRLASRASCDKGDRATADVGAGDTWTCTVTWRVAGAGMRARARYHLDVRTDGSYVADGEGPRLVNEQHTVLDTHGRTTTNPLWQFDGAVDTSP